jgi:hypothetical protein
VLIYVLYLDVLHAFGGTPLTWPAHRRMEITGVSCVGIRTALRRLSAVSTCSVKASILLSILRSCSLPASADG